MTVTAHAFFIAYRFRKRLAERDSDILHGVMGIDMQIALGFDIEVDQTVTRDLVEHMVEKRHAGIQLLLTGAIKVDHDADLRLVGIARDLCNA